MMFNLSPKAATLAAFLVTASCVVERPVADQSTADSLSARVFAVDCRGWLTEEGAIETEAALVDFAHGGGDLELQWTVDGRDLPSTQEMRSRVTHGHFLKYSLTRRITHTLTPRATIRSGSP